MKNKKIGIITLHRTTNYGSVLQSYALQEKMKDLGCTPKIIDYRPKRSTMIEMIKGLKNKNRILKKHFFVRNIVRLVMIPSYILRFRTFKKFVNDRLDLTQTKYLEEKDFENKNLDYDIYCTGSDQVWNSEWNGKIDKPLFLSFVDDSTKKISYAASFGHNEIEENEKKIIKPLLQRYANISVREKDALNILQKIGINNGKCVLDPTFLLTGEEWQKLSSDKFKNKKYILVYNLNRNKFIHDYAILLSKKTGLKIKYITYQLHDFYKKGKMYCNPPVEKFLDLIKNAQYIVTDSFHGVAFSINFNKNFMAICPNKFSSRLESILSITKLSDRIVVDTNNMDNLIKNIDYSKVNKIINNERKKSINYLKECLGD